MLGTIFLLLTTLLLTCYLQTRKPNPPKICNVYSQPGKWYYLKYSIVYILLTIRKIKSMVCKPISLKELEMMKPLSGHEKAFDATFFQAVSKDGFYFCGGIERRHRAKANGLFYIAVPELGLLESLKLPNTLLDADPASVLLMKDYSAEGISFTQIEPMKKWKVSFNGQMRLQNNEIVDVQLGGEWTSDLPFFLFETDMSTKCLSEAMARELWSKQFFDNLKSAHQTHYEQMGYFTGTLIVNSKTYNLQMDAFRDHSFGYKRDWTLLHRYIFHMLYLESGTRISMGVVSQPSTTSSLLMGYVVQNRKISAIKKSDLLLYQHGESGTPGKDYAFVFSTNKETYDVKIKVLSDSVHYKGNNIEARLVERFIECEVNGIKGRGISEWHYNNVGTFQ